MGKVMEELLIKAQRDKSKLVQVQRSVSRNGKTFMQNFWVQPSQVKSTDKVIGGQQNLLPKAGSVPKPAAGVLDKAYFESIKTDRTKAIDYLKSCGVTWADHSHQGINWMRAMQAYNAAVGNQNGTKGAQTPSTQPNSQPAPQTAQVAQNTAGNGGQGVTLTAAQQSQVDAGKNGKEKVVILKKILGNDGCMAYAKQLGISWNEHSHDAINIMRMTMALKAHFDSVDGTVSPTGGKQGGGAPKGNQNAKKDEPKKVDDTIQVTAKHTQRQANLIGLINGITDPKELELIKATGIVAEDADAKAFIEKTLKPAYYQKSNAATRNVYRGADGFSKTAADTVGTVLKLPKRLVTKAIANLADDSNGINMAVVQHPREIIPAFGSGGRGQRSVGDSEANHHYQGNGLVSILGELGGFSQLSTDESKSNKGYLGNDPAQIEAQYQKFGDDAYGVVSVLKHISEKDPSVKTEADTMTSQYLDMLNGCNHDVTMLQTVLSNKYSYLHDYVVSSDEERPKFDAAARCLRDLQSKYNLTSEDMAETVYLMNKGYYKRGKEVECLVRSDGSPVLDANGSRINVKDYISTASGDKDLAHWFSNNDRLQFLETMMRHGKTYDTLTESEHRDYISSHSYYGYSYSNPFVTRETAKRFGTLTEDKYSQIRNTYLKFAGQKIQRYDIVSDSYMDVDTSSWGASEWETFDEKANEYVSSWGSKRDFIMMPDGDNSEK
ncbi:MAG: hypothetical protein NC548_56505, partial [Lachnospiraceae bacterium]|nr:hypothetical protein [Lachnospiraceae bacterium]